MNGAVCFFFPLFAFPRLVSIASRECSICAQSFEKAGPVVKKFARTIQMTGETTRTPQALLMTVKHLVTQTFRYRQLGVPFHGW